MKNLHMFIPQFFFIDETFTLDNRCACLGSSEMTVGVARQRTLTPYGHESPSIAYNL